VEGKIDVQHQVQTGHSQILQRYISQAPAVVHATSSVKLPSNTIFSRGRGLLRDLINDDRLAA
jgi:hypothetical protein